MRWQIAVAGIQWIGLFGTHETLTTGAKSNTSEMEREFCKADKTAATVCGSESCLLHFPPFYDNTFPQTTVFSGIEQGC